MDINYVKQVMKEKKITQLELSRLSGVPLQTVKCILVGRTLYPRIDTVEAIEKALGIRQESITDISNEEKEFIEVYRQLTEEERKEFTNIASFILSKRK